MKLLLIFVVQLIYVPMMSLRTVCMVKNLKVLTTLFGFLEGMIYISGLAIVLTGEQSIAEMMIYAVGFAVGLMVGLMVEQKLAIGYSSFEVNINHHNPELIERLREKGYGVTVYEGEGRSGKRLKLDILTRRKYEKELLRYVMEIEPKAFIMSYEPKMFRGGYLGEMVKKRLSLRRRSSVSSEPSFINQTLKSLKHEVGVIRRGWKE